MSEEPNVIKNTLENVAKVTNAVSSFVPVLDFISKLINEIVSIYEKSEFSKNMCSRLVDRVLMAESEVKRATEIKDRFASLADEFDTRMRDLNFNMAIDFAMQRKLDHDELMISLNEITKILKISGLNSEVISEVQIMKSQDTS
ncbi:6575_t:CDS:2, partial [Gigaspora rosea]